MYRVVYYDRTVNASGLLAECISLEEGKRILERCLYRKRRKLHEKRYFKANARSSSVGNRS